MCGCVLWVPRVSTHFSPKLLVLLIAQDAPRKMLCVDKTLGIPASAQSFTWLFFLWHSELESLSQGDGIQPICTGSLLSPGLKEPTALCSKRDSTGSVFSCP